MSTQERRGGKGIILHMPQEHFTRTSPVIPAGEITTVKPVNPPYGETAGIPRIGQPRLGDTAPIPAPYAEGDTATPAFPRMVDIPTNNVRVPRPYES